MTTTVFLVRHGSHDRLGKVLCGRMPDVTLSERGHAEARALAQRLKREPIQALYVSPLERARETAAPIGAALGLEPTVADALNELDFGGWTGAPFEALHTDPLWARWNEARGRCRPPEGESMGEMQARVAAWLQETRLRHPDGAVVAVSHGDVIKGAVTLALEMDLDFHDRFEVSPASVSVLVTGPWGMKVHSINEAAP